VNTDAAGGFTSAKALAATVATVLVSFISVLIAAGLHVRPELRDALVNFVTVVTPIAVIVYGWLHHSHTKRVAALYQARVAFQQHPTDASPAAGAARTRAPHTR
jgi:hypothetical protein